MAKVSLTTLVGFSVADDGAVREDGDASPLRLIDDSGIGGVDEFAHMGEDLSTPVAERFDPGNDEGEGGFLRDGALVGMASYSKPK